MEIHHQSDTTWMHPVHWPLMLVALLLILTIPAANAHQEAPTDSAFTFRFVPGKDMFYSPWGGNGAELHRLVKAIDANREAIVRRQMYLCVMSHASTFTESDACGLYLVRDGRIVYDNVKLTATSGDDGAITWQPEEGVTLAGGLENESYFLYYPYQSGLSAPSDPSDLSDYTAFFRPLVDSWQPAADQSDYAYYTASDLMTAEGRIVRANASTAVLSFDMTHRMALAVIELPKTVYKFTDPDIPDYTVTATADFTGSDAKPCRMADGTYRYIVNPRRGAETSITGIYADGSKEFTLSPGGIAARNYRTYRVDGAPVTEKEHTLQAGDFLLNDGSLVGKDDLTEVQKSSVSAIVFWIASKTSTEGRRTPASLTDDIIMHAEYPSCTHGLAVALREVTYATSCTMAWQDPGESAGDWQAGEERYRPSDDGFVSIASGTGADDPINRIYGYQNTVVLRAYNAYCTASNKPDSIVRPVAALDEFIKNNVCQAPAGSTGWFLPSTKELYTLCHKDVDDIWNQYDAPFVTLNIVGSSLAAAGGDAFGQHVTGWTSTERDRRDYPMAFTVDFHSTAMVNATRKNTLQSVRAVCAF